MVTPFHLLLAFAVGLLISALGCATFSAQRQKKAKAELEQQVATRTLQLKDSMAELEELGRLQDLLLYAISHDLRTTVMGSLMLLDNVQESSDRESSRPANYPHDAPHDAPQERDGILMPRPLLQRMIQSGRMQLNRLNMLLEAYTNVASGLVLKAQLVSLDRVVQQAVEELSPLIEKNQVRLLNQMAYPCPEIWADTERLRQVFIQLLTNAIKHNPPGVEVRLESTLIEGTHPQDSIVRLTISDNGLGIDPIEQGDLFELRLKPQQERQLTPISLGLCLCKQIVTAHGGQITLNSRPGAGTRVELALPVNFRLSRNHYN